MSFSVLHMLDYITEDIEAMYIDASCDILRNKR